MGECAVNVAKSCSYVGAGTVEFILENNTDFYFLEMNTRLQVEHPITEMITGIDLVKEQLKIAGGQALSFSQEDLKINGHAIELRVYAEDPCNNFLPDIGTLSTYKIPQGLGVRVDDGFEQGMEIPIYYDPMIAKLVTHGKDREEAMQRMIRAIDEYQITGIESTLPFGKFVMQHEAFRSGNFDTHFVGKYFTPEKLQHFNEEEAMAAAYVMARIMEEAKTITKSPVAENTTSNWKKNRTN
jgi:acetyl/propionyl-CoA carboxylase alpha subunit